MGQSISRRVVPYLQRAFDKGESNLIKQEIQEVIDKQRLAKSLTRMSDPNSLQGGFTRGGLEQQEFLKSQQKGKNDEMPEDLLKFLNDMGPLQRTIDTELSSNRLMEKMKEDGVDEKTFFDAQDKELRLKRRQRWGEEQLGQAFSQDQNYTKSQQEEEAIRNVSLTKDGEKIEDEVLLLTDEEITEMLKCKTTSFVADNIKRDLTEKELNDLQIVLNNIEIPVIMQDNDEERSFVGAWDHNVKSLIKMGLTLPDMKNEGQMVPKTTDSVQN